MKRKLLTIMLSTAMIFGNIPTDMSYVFASEYSKAEITQQKETQTTEQTEESDEKAGETEVQTESKSVETEETSNKKTEEVTETTTEVNTETVAETEEVTETTKSEEAETRTTVTETEEALKTDEVKETEPITEILTETVEITEVETETEEIVETEEIAKETSDEQTYTDSNNITWKYTISNNDITIKGTEQKEFENLNIPSEIAGKKVTTIGEDAFLRCSGITGKLTIPNSITTIKYRAFDGCNGFTGNLTIPDSVTSIEWNAFNDCSGFTGNLTIPDSVTNLEEFAFNNCRGFNGTLKISNSITSIAKCTFQQCRGLTGNLVIPDSVTSIGEMAFNWCEGFTGNLTIPENVTNIEEYAFQFCSGLTGDIVIPKNITAISTGIFKDCTRFNGNLILPDKLTVIGESAFSGCRSLTGNLTIPSSVTSIYMDAFNGCSNLGDTLTIPSSITKAISADTFSGCTGFTKIINNSSQPMSIRGFKENSSEGKWYKEDSDEEFTEQHFSNTVLVYKKVEGTNYQEETYEDTASNITWKYIIVDGKEITINGITDNSACNLAIPNEIKGLPVTSIANYAFSNTDLTGSLTISKSIKNIGESAFYNRSGLTGNLVIPDSVEVIGKNAFFKCNGLTGDLNIPDSVETIGTSAFFKCSGFNGTFKMGNKVAYIGQSAFIDCNNLTGDLVIPDSVLYIGESAFRNCSGFNGTFKMGNKVAYIGQSAFYDCSSLTGALIIPNELTSIKDFVFRGCSGLTGILNIPSSVTTIGKNAFTYCSGLTGDLNIPSSVTTIEVNAFYDCSGFDGALTIPSSVTTIEKNAFSGCTGFTKLVHKSKVPLSITYFKSTDGTNKWCNADTDEAFTGTEFSECTLVYGIPKNDTTSSVTITMDKLTTIVKVGETQTLTITYSELDKASENPVTWTSSDTETVVVESTSGTGNNTAVIKALKKTEENKPVTITAKLANGSEAACTVTAIEDDEPPKQDEENPSDEPASHPDGFWVEELSSYEYTGKDIKPEPKVYDGADRLTKGKDYTLSWKNTKLAADAKSQNAPTIIIKGKGNYSGEVTLTYTITPIDINSDKVTADDIVMAVTGNEIKPMPVIYGINNTKLKNDSDFEVTYPSSGYSAEGNYLIHIKGKGNYSGEKDIMLTLTGNTLINKAVIKLDQKSYQYKGKNIIPTIKEVKLGKTVLTENDYEILEYRNNDRVGKGTVVIRGKGSYAGIAMKAFDIKGENIKKAKLDAITAQKYTGEPITPTLNATFNGEKLVLNTHYTVSYSNNINKGTATVTLTGIGIYMGTLKKTFKITPYEWSNGDTNIKTEIAAAPYMKGGSTPAVTVTYKEKTLTEGIDFTVKYSNNKTINTSAKAVITGKGNFKGNFEKTFAIEKADISNVTAACADVVYKNKNGNWKTKVTLTDINGKKLVSNTDYEKDIVFKKTDNTILSTTDKLNIGDIVTATVTAKGNYSGTKTFTYKIINAENSVAKAKLELINDQYYTGKAVMPTGDDLKITVGGKTLKYGDEYIIIGYDKNTRIGNAYITIQGKGVYGGIKKLKFKIKPQIVKFGK